jgi:hypothetical protein
MPDTFYVSQIFHSGCYILFTYTVYIVVCRLLQSADNKKSKTQSMGSSTENQTANSKARKGYHCAIVFSVMRLLVC